MNRFFNAQNCPQGGVRGNLIFTSFTGGYVLQDDQGKTLTFAQFLQADSFRVFFSYLNLDQEHECNYRASKYGSQIVFTLQDRDLKYPPDEIAGVDAYEGKVLDYWRAAFSGGKLIYDMVLSSSGLQFGFAYPSKRTSEIFIKESSDAEPPSITLTDKANFGKNLYLSLRPGAQVTPGYGYAHSRDDTSGGYTEQIYGAFVPTIGEEYNVLYATGETGMGTGHGEPNFGKITSFPVGIFSEEPDTPYVNGSYSQYKYPDPIYRFDLRASISENLASGISQKSIVLGDRVEQTFRDMRVVDYSALVFSQVTLDTSGQAAILTLKFAKALGARETLRGNVVIEATDYNYPERGTIRKTIQIEFKGI